jgi:succinate dehydrogenase / fumarate reductase, cytochrome b subunit
MSSWTDKRPMSPHMQVWKWHATMLGSILHRATGCANYVGAILVAAWLFAAASGYEAYNAFQVIAGSIIGQLALFGFTVSMTYHTLNGVKHLVMDAGNGFNPKGASFWSTLVLVASVVVAIAIWVLAGLIPGVDPLGLASAGVAK